jgi:YebC/PmpR family DNA-binding regulatory protein
MSGHSKWSTIKRKKEKTDTQRGKIFTKIIREISVAARAGGADLGSNPRLRTAVDTARAVNMPADNIKRGILKGVGGLEGVNYEQQTYEGYGPGGVAVLVETLTDNKNRTVAEIRHSFTKHVGSLGEIGCVGWMFDRKGHITVEKNTIGEDEMMEKALDLGASDFQTSDDAYDIYSEFADFETVRSGLEKAGAKIAAAEMAMIPQTTIKLEGKQAEQMIKLMEELEDLDDVQKVYANFDIDESVLEKLTGG